MHFEHINRTVGSLRFRLASWNTLMVLLTIVATLVGIREGSRLMLLRDNLDLLEDDAQELALAIAQFHPDMQAIFDEMDRKTKGHEHRQLFVQLFDARNKLLRSSPRADQADKTSISTAGTESWDRPPFKDTRRSVMIGGRALYTLRVGSSLAGVEADVSRLTALTIRWVWRCWWLRLSLASGWLAAPPVPLRG